MSHNSAVPLIGISEDELRISTMLPYFFYYEELGIFFNIDGSITAMYEVYPPNRVYDDYVDTVFKNLYTFFNKHREKVVIQMILAINNGISVTNPVLKYYANNTKDSLNDFLKRTINNKIIAIASEGKEIRRLISITLLPPKPGLKDDITSLLFGSGRDTKDACIEHAAEQLIKLDKIIEEMEIVFSSTKIGMKRANATDLLDILYPIFNGKQRLKEGYDKLTPLREQIANSPMVIDGRRISLADINYNVVFINSIRETVVNYLFSEDMDGNAIVDKLSNFILTYNIYTNSPRKELNVLYWKNRLATSILTGVSSAKGMAVREMTMDAIKRVEVDKTHLLNATITAVVREENTSEFVNYLETEGLDCRVEENEFLLPAFLITMPFFYRTEYDRTLQMGRKMYPENLASLMPLYPKFQGTRDGTHIYIDRRREPVSFDLFKSSNAAHTVILGETGAGKSFFTNDFITQQLTREGKTIVLIIDKGNSYGTTCSLFNGSRTVLDPDNAVTMNPFYKLDPYSNEQFLFITTLLSFMITGIDERDRLTRADTGFLEDQVRKFIEEGGLNTELTLSDFASYIKEKGERGNNFYERIFPFTEKGRYGRFFDGKNQFGIDNDFTVFELGNIDDQELLTAWFMIVSHFFTLKAQAKENLGVKKFFILDEAWKLLGMESTIKYFFEVVKSYRKFGASLVTITQDFDDFFSSPAGTAVFNNSPNKILLRMSPDAINKYRDSMMLSDWEMNQIYSLKSFKQTGKYSEIFVKFGRETSGTLRVLPSKEIYWMSTTDNMDKRRIEDKLKETNGDIAEALISLIKEDEKEVSK